MTKRLAILSCLMFLGVGGLIPAAEPPAYVNYQGVLRDAVDNPLDGTYDMEFRFYDRENLGNRLLTDTHDGADAVVVSGGLFNVELGGGTITAGLDSALDELFANRSIVWLEIEIEGERLSPRVRLLSSGFAMNSDHLDGMNSTDFSTSGHLHDQRYYTETELQTAGNADVSWGNLTTVPEGFADGVDDVGVLAETDPEVGALTVGAVPRWTGSSLENGAVFDNGSSVGIGTSTPDAELTVSGTGHFVEDSNTFAWVGHGTQGVNAQGSQLGGFFRDSDNTSRAYIGYDQRGIEAYGDQFGVYARGTAAGAHFLDEEGTSEVHLAWGDQGINAEGDDIGGFFRARDPLTGRAYLGNQNTGIHARGTNAAGYFENDDDGSIVRIAYQDQGVRATGNLIGGYFENAAGENNASLATDQYGVHAFGTTAGGRFEYNGSGGGSGIVALAGNGIGLVANSSVTAAQFGSTSTPTGIIVLASGRAGSFSGGNGIYVSGDYAGHFNQSGGNGEVYLAREDWGVVSYGDNGAGWFENTTATDTGRVQLAVADNGIVVHHSVRGGYFENTTDSGRAWLGDGDYGIRATGSVAGGSFNVVEIFGGSDIAEPFPIQNREAVAKGAVLVIDESTPGALTLSTAPYDRRVAGIVSGAGGIDPGITLRHSRLTDDQMQVAIAGRVYCQATAENGPIRAGDLLTTSSLAGHAMRADDRELSHGAILGKAMSGLESGEGLVMVLVNLQ